MRRVRTSAPAARAVRSIAASARRRARVVVRGCPEPPVGMEVALAGLARRGFAPRGVVDVGAAVGGWTELALAHWPHADYLLVEPLEERRAALEALAGRDRRVRVVMAAAGERAGTATLNVAPDLFGSSLKYAGVEARRVDVVALDDVLAEGGPEHVDLLK